MTLTKEQCLEDLKKNYTKIGHEIAFSGIKTIFDYYKGVLSQDVIKDFLAENFSYTSHKIPFRKTKRNFTYCYNLRQKWEADLFEISKISQHNANYKHVLMVEDIFSRRAFARLLKSKKPDEVIDRFGEILEEAESAPKSLFTGR